MTGRVAVVTGGAGALGTSVCRRFLEAGATVWVPYHVEAEWDALRAGLAPPWRERAHGAPVDVTDEPALGELVRRILAAHGRVDTLVNGVGGFAGGDLLATTLADWNRMLALNLTSAFLACRAVLPAMREARHGRVVNVASRAVVPPSGGFIAYTVAKAGVITLTEALAQEVRGDGITVNAVLPSTMDTPANRRAMPDADRAGWVRPDAVADVIVWLASDRAGSVTGTAIAV
jgi:NAD(P)-dependent dehydrogenase (short-subunit alcohol dehydrogenase family)